jgi:hypothetical protein
LIKNKLSIIWENQKRLNVRSNRNCTEWISKVVSRLSNERWN